MDYRGRLHSQLLKRMRRAGIVAALATSVDASFKVAFIGEMLGFEAAFSQTGIVRIFAEKKFIYS